MKTFYLYTFLFFLVMTKAYINLSKHNLAYDYIQNNPEANYLQVQKNFKISAKTVSKLKVMINNGAVPILTEVGRKQKITKEHRKLVLDRTLEKCTTGCRTMSNTLIVEPKIGETSVRLIRHQLGFRFKPKRKAPILTPAQIQKRLEFCERFQSFDRKSVLFTDESRFSMESDAPHGWIKRGVYNADSFQPQSKYSRSTMFWGGIMFNKKTQLLVCDSPQNSPAYINMLEDAMIFEMIDAEKGSGNWYFQQDNAPSHSSDATINYLGLRAMIIEWPANSADLNPIEQIWAIMKRRLQNTIPASLEQLEEIVMAEWGAISPQTILGLIASMKYRIQLCTQNGGKSIGHLISRACQQAKNDEAHMSMFTNTEMIGEDFNLES